MSGLINKLTHRHNTPATTTANAPIISQSAGGPIITGNAPTLAKTNLNTSGGMLNSGSVLNTSTPLTTSNTIQNPSQYATTHISAPIVQETVRNDRVVEVQPVLHREVDQNIVHHIEKHYHEHAPTQGGVIERQPVVQQQIHTNLVHEIQPIIHRERVIPVVERTEQHLTQHIVQPTIHTHEVVYERGSYNQGLYGSGGIQQGLGQQGFQQGLGQQGFQQGLGQQGLYQNGYQGLNFPFTGASNHPSYGYQRLPRDQKAQRFEQKAAEWERRGNLTKAQKNREKALRYRQMSQPGYTRPIRPQNYYSDRANLFDQKALRFQQLGMAPQAQRYQGRSQRLRAKHNLGPYQGQQGLGQQSLGQQAIGLGQQGVGQQGRSWTLQGLPQDKLQQEQQLQQQQFSSAR